MNLRDSCRAFFLAKNQDKRSKKMSQKNRVIRKPELLNMVGLSDPTIWRMEKNGTFPKRIRLGGNSCGWLENEITFWLSERAAARR
jgi:prophage regulatory protein